MACHLSTKDRLLSIVDDIELISKELIENLAPKHQKLSSSDHGQLVELLVSKDNDMKQLLKLADEQEKIQMESDGVKAQVEKYDQDINLLQKQLKEAEQILSTAIFQAKQKLATISNANKRPIHSEDLIKFAHRISASHAVSAPLTWQVGDLRRPYPTDIEMRLGFLGKSDLAVNGNTATTPSSVTDANRTAEITASAQTPTGQNKCGKFSPQSKGSTGKIENNFWDSSKFNTSQDDASTDSSSSCSSDSQ